MYQAKINKLCTTSPLDSLPGAVPIELWTVIFDSLPLRDLTRISCVCRSFMRLANDELVNPVLKFKRKREEMRAKVWGDFYRKQNGEQGERR